MKPLALITGGTSGIWQEFANQLAKKGYDIIIIGRNKLRGEEISEQIKETYWVNITLILADLSKKSGMNIVEECIQNLNHLDFLINAAWFWFPEEFLDGDISKWESMISVHNIATMRLCYAAGNIMKRNKNGNIINVASLASYLQVGNPLYASVKVFIRYFSLNLFYEWKKYWIYVQALCPGFVKTNFFSTAGLTKTPSLGLLTTEVVVKASLSCSDKKKPICIPWFTSKILKILIQLLPNSLVYKISKKNSFN